MSRKINNKTKKKVQRNAKKLFRKRPLVFVILLMLLIDAALTFLYFAYEEGYLDGLFNREDNNTIDTNYGHFEQNEDGYYYYTDIGFSEGEYYHEAKDLVGEDLIKELNILVNENFNPISYGDARYVLSYSDRNPNDNFESVRGIYDNDIISTTLIGTGQGSWQREHVWPNSKLGIPRVNNNSKNLGSDLHNLRAITGINQTRSNRYFAAGSGTATTVGSQGFYPGDEHKGDVARILFYMIVMYDFLELTDDASLLENDPDTNYTLDGTYQGLLSLLINWHKEDPVDEFEIARNEFIYSGYAKDPNGKVITPQGNRNPFIDKPELVHLIWEDMSISDLIKPEEVEDTSFKFNNNQIKLITHFSYFKQVLIN